MVRSRVDRFTGQLYTSTVGLYCILYATLLDCFDHSLSVHVLVCFFHRKDYVHKEAAMAKKWEGTWGFLQDEYQAVSM